MERTNYTERNSFGLPNIVIPAEVLFHPDLTSREKLLFGFINNLAYTEKGCWASNKYLGRLIGVRPDTTSTAIAKLAELEFISLEYHTRSSDGMTVRKIHINKRYLLKYSGMLQEKAQEIEAPKVRKKVGRPKKQSDKIQKGVWQNPKGDLEDDKRGLGFGQNNIDNKLENELDSIKDTKVSYVPSEHSEEILQFWNNLDNTIRHKPSSKTYQRACQMIDNLIQGYPLLHTKDGRPHKNLVSFCKKHSIPQEILSRTWSTDEIKEILSSITESMEERLSLENILWNTFARGGGFSYFLFEADKKQTPQKYIGMAEVLSQAIGTSLSPSKKLHWAKEFQSLHNENGKTEAQINEVLDWYLQNYDYPKVRSVMDAEEFCSYYGKIRKSMQIQKEDKRPQRSKLSQAHHGDPDKAYPC